MFKYNNLFFDPFKLTGPEGYMNYKLSGVGSGNRKNMNNSNKGGGFFIVIIVVIVIILLACTHSY